MSRQIAACMADPLFPEMRGHFLDLARRANPQIRTLGQAVRENLVFEGVVPGRTKNATIFLRHPTERRSAKIGLVSWDADGAQTYLATEHVIWPVSSMLRMEPRIRE